MTRRRSLTLGLATLTLLMGCGQSGDSPERVATRWRRAVANGDFATEWDLEGPGLQPRQGDRAAGIAFLRSIYKPPTPDHEVVAIKATSTVKDTGDPKSTFVFVYLQVTERAYPPGQETLTLRKVGAVWRVAKWQP